MYGLNEDDRKWTLQKIRYQKQYLYENMHDFGNVKIPYADFFQNSWHNSHRYIAELNHRVWSLNKYAEERGLKLIFATLTLPSEYHKKRTITVKGKKKLVRNDNYIDDMEHKPNHSSKVLGSIHRSIMNSKVFRSMRPEDRCYLAVREPHKNGTPHLHVAYFVPETHLQKAVSAIERRFISEQSKVEISVNNPTAYIMKYVLKTLDDLRENSDIENLTDLTLWYIRHKIPRVTMSRTFVSLDIYRSLKGQYDLMKLTAMFKEDRLQVFINPTTRQIVQITDDYGDLWQKRQLKVTPKEFQVFDRPCLRSQHQRDFRTIPLQITNKDGSTTDLSLYISPDGLQSVKDLRFMRKAPYQMSDFELFEHYHDLDFDDPNINPHYLANCHNEMSKREYPNFEKVSINHFNLEKYFEDLPNDRS
jgi:hypothetical protein